MPEYVHGYAGGEATRLADQAAVMEELFHDGTSYPPGARVLEAGCGVGAQTVVLARRNPGVVLTAVDISAASLEAARRRAAEAGVQATFRQADLMRLPADLAGFDHAWGSFVLEHVADRRAAVQGLFGAVRPGGTLTLVEVDHGTTRIHPADPDAMAVWHARLRAQRAIGANGEAGHALFPLLQSCGFRVDAVTPRVLYVDARMPERAQAIIGQVVAPAMVSSRAAMLQHAGIDEAAADRGIAATQALADQPDFVFCSTLFRVVATRP